MCFMLIRLYRFLQPAIKPLYNIVCKRESQDSTDDRTNPACSSGNASGESKKVGRINLNRLSGYRLLAFCSADFIHEIANKTRPFLETFQHLLAERSNKMLQTGLGSKTRFEYRAAEHSTLKYPSALRQKRYAYHPHLEFARSYQW